MIRGPGRRRNESQFRTSDRCHYCRAPDSGDRDRGRLPSRRYRPGPRRRSPSSQRPRRGPCLDCRFRESAGPAPNPARRNKWSMGRSPARSTVRPLQTVRVARSMPTHTRGADPRAHRSSPGRTRSARRPLSVSYRRHDRAVPRTSGARVSTVTRSRRVSLSPRHAQEACAIHLTVHANQ